MSVFINKHINDNSFIIKLKNNNNITGWLSYTIYNEFINIDTIFIYNKYRNNGFASLLLNHFINLFPNRTFKAVILGNDDNIECIKLFSKFEFNKYYIDEFLFMIK